MSNQYKLKKIIYSGKYTVTTNMKKRQTENQNNYQLDSASVFGNEYVIDITALSLKPNRNKITFRLLDQKTYSKVKYIDF